MDRSLGQTFLGPPSQSNFAGSLFCFPLGKIEHQGHFSLYWNFMWASVWHRALLGSRFCGILGQECHGLSYVVSPLRSPCSLAQMRHHRYWGVDFYCEKKGGVLLEAAKQTQGLLCVSLFVEHSRTCQPLSFDVTWTTAFQFPWFSASHLQASPCPSCTR